jgi:hypothetical protein
MKIESRSTRPTCDQCRKAQAWNWEGKTCTKCISSNK